MEYLLIYFGAISLLSIIVCCYDKIAAIKGRRRIKEKTLLLLAILGGAIALYITMRIIRHKTLHNKFMLGLPLIILLQISVVLLIYYKKL